MIKVDNKEFDVMTHPGAFHTDEVLASVLLKYALDKPDLKVARLPKVPEDKKDLIVYDVGGGRYDHHFEPKKIREDGRLYSSAGLIWADYKLDVIGNLPISETHKTFLKEEIKKGYDLLEDKIIYPVDAQDNGIALDRPNPFGEVLALLGYEEDKNLGFEIACDLTEKIFLHAVKNEISKYSSKIDFENFYRESREDDAYREVNAIYLKKFVPWKDFLFVEGRDEDINFVIYPSLRGGFMADAVADGPMSFKNKKPFPESWRGKPVEELRKISGIEDAIFCHANGFCFSAEKLGSVIKACEIANK